MICFYPTLVTTG